KAKRQDVIIHGFPRGSAHRAAACCHGGGGEGSIPGVSLGHCLASPTATLCVNTRGRYTD
ncbi:MAG: hypothetical protein OQK74_10385, partial [Gammaproteobacteria bacterium]|nr:hypothetical protein [Gammaproteobacteria bacterium]